MNIVVVLPYANTERFDICFEVNLTTGLWLHTGSATHRPQRNSCPTRWRINEAIIYLLLLIKVTFLQFRKYSCILY